MTFLSLFIYVKQLDSCISPLASQLWPCEGHVSHQSPQVQKVSHWGPKEEIWKGGIKMPRMRDASPVSDPGFLHFAAHCDIFWCNSISIFLLHFKVAENNTLNRKMKYVLSPACYLSPPLPPSACLHAHLI